MDTWTGGGKDPRKIKVTFPDGTVIHENTGKSTFMKTILKIGVEKVQELNMKWRKHPLISKHMHSRESSWHHDVDSGFYIYKDMNKSTMFEQLKEINDRLGLGLRLEFL